MKIKLTFKTPDILFYSLQKLDLNEDEKKDVTRIVQKFIKGDEYVTVVVDTENETATVEKV